MDRVTTVTVVVSALLSILGTPAPVTAQPVDCDHPEHLLTAALVQEIRLLRRDLLASRAAELRADALTTRLRSQQEIVRQLSDRVEGFSREEMMRESRMSGEFEQERQRMLRRRLETVADERERMEIESEIRMLELRATTEADRRAEQDRLAAEMRNRLADERDRLDEIVDEIERLGDDLLRRATESP